MTYSRKLPRTRPLKKGHRGYKTWLLVLGWLFLSLGSPAQAQNCLESQGLRFCLIPGGSYFLGSPLHEAGRYTNEPTPYRVTLKPVYLAATATTNAQYTRFLAATGHPAPLAQIAPRAMRLVIPTSERTTAPSSGSGQERP